MKVSRFILFFMIVHFQACQEPEIQDPNLFDFFIESRILKDSIQVDLYPIYFYKDSIKEKAIPTNLIFELRDEADSLISALKFSDNKYVNAEKISLEKEKKYSLHLIDTDFGFKSQAVELPDDIENSVSLNNIKVLTDHARVSMDVQIDYTALKDDHYLYIEQKALDPKLSTQYIEFYSLNDIDDCFPVDGEDYGFSKSCLEREKGKLEIGLSSKAFNKAENREIDLQFSRLHVALYSEEYYKFKISSYYFSGLDHVFSDPPLAFNNLNNPKVAGFIYASGKKYVALIQHF